MPFDDPVVAGNTLIRAAIRSPDYVQGVSGWSINRDGTAEFNDVTVRGELFVQGANGSSVRIFDDVGFAMIQLDPEDQVGFTFEPAEVTGVSSSFGDASLVLSGPFPSPMIPTGDPFPQIFIGFTDVSTVDPYSHIRMTARDIDMTADLDVSGNIEGTDITATDDVISNGTTLNDPPGAQLRQTAGQSIANGTFGAITFTAEDYDNLNGHSNVTNTSRYVCQRAGRYQLSGKVAFVTNTNGRRITQWRVNGSGTPVSGSQISTAVGAGADAKQFAAATITVLLAVNDYVELHAFQDSGGSLNTDVADAGSQSFMHIRWVGDA